LGATHWLSAAHATQRARITSQCGSSPEHSASPVQATHCEVGEHTLCSPQAAPGVHSTQRPLAASHAPRAHGLLDEQRATHVCVVSAQRLSDEHSESARH
jgi:hypothetical protein